MVINTTFLNELIKCCTTKLWPDLPKAKPDAVKLAESIALLIETHGNLQQTDYEVPFPAMSVFNRLNGCKSRMHYPSSIAVTEKGIPYPIADRQKLTDKQQEQFKDTLSKIIEINGSDLSVINRKMSLLEQTAGFVTVFDDQETADISLFDHIKLCLSVAVCLTVADGHSSVSLDVLRKEPLFLLASLDMSGIQKFIYTIAPGNALRLLRSRSFYLDLLMENTIDDLLVSLKLPRACVIYSGGGHCYILLPNTEQVRQTFDETIRSVNHWLLERFQTSLFLAGAYVPCSADNLSDLPKGSYGDIFRSISGELAKRKMARYTASQILMLNKQPVEDDTRECVVCKRIDNLSAANRCPFCESLIDLSKNILYAKYFVVVTSNSIDGVPLPSKRKLIAFENESDFLRFGKESYFVRCYAKNPDLWSNTQIQPIQVGNYSNGLSFEEMAKKASGIKRIGILRADVDNLGQAFISGFYNQAEGNRYVTLSRSAAFSRQLSAFFKNYINLIPQRACFNLQGSAEDNGIRHVSIVYSGGDDLFIAGAWDDVIGLAVDIRNSLERYTEGTLTLSAGVGIYHPHFPVHVIARETGELESKSKHKPGKNALTLMEDGDTHIIDSVEISDGTFDWKIFEEHVVKEKLRLLLQFLGSSQERGTAFLYRLLELIRTCQDRINFARLVYLLARLEPSADAPDMQRDEYRRFMGEIVRWSQNESDRRELKMAIMIYAYLNRDQEE